MTTDPAPFSISPRESTEGLIRLVPWLPRDEDLYLQVCDHPNAHDQVRYHLLDRSSINRFEQGLTPTLLDHMRDQHPLAVSLYDIHRLPISYRWFPARIADLCYETEHDPKLARVTASLLRTWDGTLPDLLATARGILAVA